MTKPCKLQMNNSGAWKDVVRFDAADEERADEILNAAEALANACNDGQRRPVLTLRVVTDDGLATVLMQHSSDLGWRDARTGEPA